MSRGRRLYVSWQTTVCLARDRGGRLYVSWRTTLYLLADDCMSRGGRQEIGVWETLVLVLAVETEHACRLGYFSIVPWILVPFPIDVYPFSLLESTCTDSRAFSRFPARVDAGFSTYYLS